MNKKRKINLKKEEKRKKKRSRKGIIRRYSQIEKANVYVS